LVPDRGGRALEGGGGAIDNAEVAVTIDQSHGSEFLAQRVVRCRPGLSGPHRLEATQEIVFVESGRGILRVGDETHPLEPDTGAYVVSGEEYELESSGPDDLVVVVVEAPQEDGAASTPVRRTVRFADQPTLPAGLRPGVPLPRQPGCRLPRHHAVRRADRAGSCTEPQPYLRRDRLHHRWRRNPPSRRGAEGGRPGVGNTPSAASRALSREHRKGVYASTWGLSPLRRSRLEGARVRMTLRSKNKEEG
jgi:mannose-6-phosphate isomerase-like protein (cupin superfamily)